VSEFDVPLVGTTCVCGEARTEPYCATHDRAVGTCVRCGLTRTLQMATDYETLYTEGDRYHVARQGHTPYRERFEHDHEVGHLRLREFAARLRWLDVGCANGGFVAAANDLGYAVEGLEPNPGIAAWAAQATGRPIHRTWDTVLGWFDVITLHDVFEHVVDPVQYLNVLRSHLVPGGMLILDVPDIHDTGAREYGPYSHHMKPLEHLWFWERTLLTRFVGDHGFEVVDVHRPIPGKLVVYARRAV
jgi:SAM-dependent methyltransferase